MAQLWLPKHYSTEQIFVVNKYHRLPVDMDMSMCGILQAAERCVKEYGAEANMVLCAPENYHYAELAISKLAGRYKLLAVVLTTKMSEDEWAVGCSYYPDSFFGSIGA